MTTHVEIGGDYVLAYVDDETGRIVDPRGHWDRDAYICPLFHPRWISVRRRVEPIPSTKLGNPTTGTFHDVLTRCATYNEEHSGEFPGLFFCLEVGQA